jgi:lipoprotein-anchoring transpeptidase ErfK/SrfK
MKIIRLLFVLVLMVVSGCGAADLAPSASPIEPAPSASPEEMEPAGPSYEILVLLDTKKLYLFCDEELFKTYTVAVGKLSSPTPKGDFTVMSMIEYPYADAYGSRWIGLSTPNIGIHGTNRPSSIGKDASRGCIRMRNEDIEELFSFISIGTKVFIL